MSVITHSQYQQNLGNQIKRVNESDSPDKTVDLGMPSTDHFDQQYQENYSSIANHFQVPNLSSMLYEFTNREAEKVQ